MEKFIKSKLLLQIIVASFVATLATASIVGATTIGTDISTGGTLAVTGVTTLGNNITVPAAYGLDTTGAGALNIGTSTATSIKIGDTGVTTTFPGDVAITGTLSAGATTITGLVLNNKTLTLTDSITLNATSTTDGHIMIADATTGSWINKAVSGDITITKAGVTAIVANAVAGTDIALANEAAGDIMYANGTDWVRLAKSTDGFILTLSNGAPAWVATTTLANISGTLAVANGGTGATTLTSNGVLYGNGTGAIQATAAGTGGYVLAVSNGIPAWVATSSMAASGANGDITSLTAIASIDKAGAITIGNTNATALIIGRNGITTTFPGAATFSSTGSFANTLNVNGYATTTAAGVIMPTQQYTTNTGCDSTTVGGLMFNASKQILCVCTGTTWKAATSTTAVDCF